MKKILILFAIITMFSCEKKINYYELKNDDETYYLGDKPFTGQALSDIKAKIPSTVYNFIDGHKQSEIEYYSESAGGKIKHEKNFTRTMLEDEKEYSKDGLLLKMVNYVWDDDRESAEVYIEWYDWCGKMKRRKSLKCDKFFDVIEVNYDQEIPQPCN